MTACRNTLSIAFILVTQANIAFSNEPVMIGREIGFDACSGISEVKVQATVYEAPDLNSEIIEILPEGTRLWDCDWREADGHDWVGVIYPADGETECGPMSQSIPEAIAYDGPCASGWIAYKDLRGIAG